MIYNDNNNNNNNNIVVPKPKSISLALGKPHLGNVFVGTLHKWKKLMCHAVFPSTTKPCVSKLGNLPTPSNTTFGCRNPMGFEALQYAGCMALSSTRRKTKYQNQGPPDMGDCFFRFQYKKPEIKTFSQAALQQSYLTFSLPHLSITQALTHLRKRWSKGKIQFWGSTCGCPKLQDPPNTSRIGDDYDDLHCTTDTRHPDFDIYLCDIRSALF